jgi:hypothetical protein
VNIKTLAYTDDPKLGIEIPLIDRTLLCLVCHPKGRTRTEDVLLKYTEENI